MATVTNHRPPRFGRVAASIPFDGTDNFVQMSKEDIDVANRRPPPAHAPDVQFFSRALTHEEVQASYAQSRAALADGRA